MCNGLSPHTKLTVLERMNDHNVLVIRNTQRSARIHGQRFRRIILAILREDLGLKNFDLGCYLVSDKQMEVLNTTYLKHSGSTDVITFDHSAGPELHQFDFMKMRSPFPRIHGEIFISVDTAVTQARGYKTSWQNEVIRYTIHGVLHLLGYDDTHGQARKVMKREENRLMRQAQKKYLLDDFGFLHRTRRKTPG